MVDQLYPYVKALHIIFMVTWFAGLFYIPRLFVYQVEASLKPEPAKSILGKQLGLMAKRLWKIITAPSLVLCSIFAALLLFINPAWLQAGWMQLKLGFVALLYLYHYKTWLIFKDLQAGNFKYTSKYLRLWNEGATLILFAVVFLVITKSTTNFIWGIVGLLGLAFTLMLGIKLYRSIQEKNPDA